MAYAASCARAAAVSARSPTSLRALPQLLAFAAGPRAPPRPRAEAEPEAAVAQEAGTESVELSPSFSSAAARSSSRARWARRVASVSSACSAERRPAASPL